MDVTWKQWILACLKRLVALACMVELACLLAMILFQSLGNTRMPALLAGGLTLVGVAGFGVAWSWLVDDPPRDLDAMLLGVGAIGMIPANASVYQWAIAVPWANQQIQNLMTGQHKWTAIIIMFAILYTAIDLCLKWAVRVKPGDIARL